MAVGVVLKKMSRIREEESLEELVSLAETAGADVKKKVIQALAKPDPATFIGSGKAEEIREAAEKLNVDFLLFDTDLTPAQVKNLEQIFDKKIIDRSGLILDIFAKRARTKEARLQVELAQLNYYLPRLTRAWTHLSRQEGAIGTRGPGETQLEVDRRAIRRRISSLERQLAVIEKQRIVRRRGRRDIYKVALVGYTNAGKSSLLNALTGSDVFVEDRLFATLDSTIRRFRLEEGKDALLIDTVGFIKKLPHHLVASFRSTLKEAEDADLLLHIVDVSTDVFEEHIEVVNDVLRELGIHKKPRITVFNKIDAGSGGNIDVAGLRTRYKPALFTSATRGMGLQDVKNQILKILMTREKEVSIKISVNDSKTIARVYDLASVISTEYEDDVAIIKFRAEQGIYEKIKRLTDHEKNIDIDN
ncbi:GTPase HflX [bacterium]|nr:GTPase HflX [bacterium]